MALLCWSDNMAYRLIKAKSLSEPMLAYYHQSWALITDAYMHIIGIDELNLTGWKQHKLYPGSPSKFLYKILC